MPVDITRQIKDLIEDLKRDHKISKQYEYALLDILEEVRHLVSEVERFKMMLRKP